MLRPLLVVSGLFSLLLWSADRAGRGPAVAQAGPAAEPTADIGGKIGLLRLAVPAGDEVGDILRRDAELSAGYAVIDRSSIPAALIKETGFDRAGWEQLGAQAVIKNAVRRMLPKNRLGRAMAKKLKVYRGAAHPHQAQQPQALEVK